MSTNEVYTYKNIIKGMNEGVITIDLKGHISTVNPAAKKLFSLKEKDIGTPFASHFFGNEENDAFNETVLNAIYNNNIKQNAIVNYNNGKSTKELFVSTTFLKKGNEKIGVTIVVNDITRITELQNTIKAMEKIKKLNAELEKRNIFIRRNIGKFLPDDVVDDIITQAKDIKIIGKKAKISIMFSDIRGFTAISDSMPAKALINLLNHYLKTMTEIIQRNKGSILDFIGDSIVVAFGVPLSVKTHADNAIRCAIEMQNAMEIENKYEESQGMPQIEMGIGIHTGMAIIGNIGSQNRTKYDIIGKNVNLASRIESYTVGGEILVSQDTIRNLHTPYTMKSSFSILPKGLKRSINVYRVNSLGSISLRKNEEILTPIDPPNSVVFHLVKGKDISKESYNGDLISTSKKEAIIKVLHPFEVNSNIVFQNGSTQVYAKIIARENGQIRIHRTMGDIESLSHQPIA